jgi:hypothetical protein
MKKTFSGSWHKLLLLPCLVAAALGALPGKVCADPVTDATSRVTGTKQAEASSVAGPPSQPEPKSKLQVAFAGGFALSAAFVDWRRPTASGARDGDLRFSVLRIGARASYDAFKLEFEYRIYPFTQFLRNAVLAYHVNDRLSFDVGVSRVPFGLLPFASNSWFFGLPYYMGLEDDADFGLRAHWLPGNWDLWLTFYKNSEGSYLGKSLDSARFSYDAVQARQEELAGSGISAARNDRETNTGAARVAYTFHQGKFAAELGASARLGQLEDLVTDQRSVYWSVAPHARITYGLTELGLEGIAYRYKPHAGPDDDERLVAMGAFDAPYAMARRGYVLVANIAQGFEIAWGPLERLVVYFDTGQLWKSSDAFKTTRQLVVGSYVLAGPIHMSVDAAFGQHHPWIGPDYGAALGAGGDSARWHHWINVNLGFAY